MGRAIGRFDWWNIKAEHTDYEWIAQLAMYSVCPFGEKRADWRAAFHTTRLVAASSMAKIDESELKDMQIALSSYLKCDEATDDEEPDMDALAIMTSKPETTK